MASLSSKYPQAVVISRLVCFITAFFLHLNLPLLPFLCLQTTLNYIFFFPVGPSFALSLTKLDISASITCVTLQVIIDVAV